MQFTRQQYNEKYSELRLVCIVCSSEIKKNTRINYNQYLKQKFCSLPCKGLWLQENFKGENNPNYVSGQSSENEIIRGSPKYKRWRAFVFARDNYTCQVCAKRGGEINADHIKSFAKYPKLRFDINNGRTLCRMCHTKTPSYGKKLKRKNI